MDDSTPSPAKHHPQDRSNGLVFQSIVALGGLVAFVFLLMAEETTLSPLVIAAAGLLLLWPFRDERPVRALLMAGGLVFGLWMLNRLGGILAPFVLVLLVAYILDPVVTWAQERFRVKRWISALLLSFLFVGLLVLFVLLLVPVLVGQIERLASSVISLVSGLPAWIEQARILDSLEDAGLVERASLVRELATFLPGQIESIASQLPSAAASLTRSASTLVGIVVIIALIPILLFYILKDYGEIRDALFSLFPRYRGNRDYLRHTSKVVGNYLRGQMLISLLGAIIVTIPLVIVGVPFALLIGLMAGLLNMIPNLGAVITYIIGGFLMLAFGSLGDFLIVMGVLVGQSFLEQSVLTPNIMGQAVGLHPVLIIFSLFAFSTFLGFLGLLIAVPVTALLVQLYKSFRSRGESDVEVVEGG